MRDARYMRLISWTLRCGSEHVYFKHLKKLIFLNIARKYPKVHAEGKKIENCDFK
jgi:hypothetical protein